jgi:hypothetical protein
MPSTSSPLGLTAASALLLAFALGGAGCGTKPKADSFDAAVAAGERPVAMRGETAFFGGQLNALVTISRGVGRGGNGGGGKGHHGGGLSPNEGERLDADSYGAYMQARGALGSPLPPITIHLKLENRSAQVYQVEIQEMNSDLGNFAVEPSLLSLAPGQVSEPNPMISQLGVTSDDIPVTVTLRMGGKTETHVIAVISTMVPPSAPIPDTGPSAAEEPQVLVPKDPDPFRPGA